MPSHFSRRSFLATAAGAALALKSARAQPREVRDSLVRYTRPRSYRARHSVAATRAGTRLSSLELWIPVPTGWNEQKITDVMVTPKLTPVSAQNGPTRVARLLLRNASELKAESFRIVVESTWQRYEIATDMTRLHAQEFLPYDANADDYKAFIGPEDKVESNDAEIREIAAKLKGQNRPAAHLAHDIYEWVLDRTTYQNIGWKGARWCRENRTGACGDYSALFVALCRAAGIPARINAGYWASEKNGMHVWAEFLLPTGEWIPLMPPRETKDRKLGSETSASSTTTA